MTTLFGQVPLGLDPSRKTVDLLRVDPEEFREPFFEHTVNRLREERGGEILTVTWDELIEDSASWSPVRNMGALIFNVGRCGSTMLSNMIRSHPGVWALSEPEPLSKPELVARRSMDLATRTAAETIYNLCSRLLEGRAEQAGKTLVVKYPSWLAARAPAISTSHPDAAILGLYRDPLEVVASYIQKPPVFAGGMHAPAATQMSVTPALATMRRPEPMTAAVYFAAIFASTLVGMMAVPENRLLILDYRHLTADVVAVARKVFSHLDLPATEETLSAVVASTSRYAKSKDDGVKFDPKGAHARRALTPRTQREVSSVVEDTMAQIINHPAHFRLNLEESP